MKPEELMTIIKSRRSVRKFKPDPVPKNAIEKMIEAASWAPSGSNLQNWHFIVVESEELKHRMSEALIKKVNALAEKIVSATAKKEYTAYTNYYTFFVNAPAVIAVVKKPYNSLALRIMERYGFTDDYVSTADIQGPSAAIQNLLLTAHSLGYGTCWMTGPMIARKELEEVLGIKSPDELMALIPVGKPDVVPQAPKRKPVGEITEYK